MSAPALRAMAEFAATRHGVVVRSLAASFGMTLYDIRVARLGIEAHSRAFHFGPIREAADEDRDLRVATIGWEVLYLGWYAQRRPAEVVEIIARVCRGRLQLLRSA